MLEEEGPPTLKGFRHTVFYMEAPPAPPAHPNQPTQQDTLDNIKYIKQGGSLNWDQQKAYAESIGGRLLTVKEI